jgi:hypothetical protein
MIERTPTPVRRAVVNHKQIHASGGLPRATPPPGNTFFFLMSLPIIRTAKRPTRMAPAPRRRRPVSRTARCAELDHKSIPVSLVGLSFSVPAIGHQISIFFFFVRVDRHRQLLGRFGWPQGYKETGATQKEPMDGGDEENRCCFWASGLD